MNRKCVNIFVLGAGASVDYGLPVWDELKGLLIEEITNNGAIVISPDVTNRLQHEMKEIGPTKKYETVDQMISKVSRKLPDFAATTQELFSVIKTIFKANVTTENVGWIETFVQKNNIEIFLEDDHSDNSTVFINFNYDTLLVSKIVEFFNHKFLGAANEEKGEWYARTGLDFEQKFRDCARDIYHPHGVLYLSDGNEVKIGEKTFCYPTTKTCINAQTFGTRPEIEYLGSGSDNPVSCHDAYENFTFSEIKERVKWLAGDDRTDVEI